MSRSHRPARDDDECVAGLAEAGGDDHVHPGVGGRTIGAGKTPTVAPLRLGPPAGCGHDPGQTSGAHGTALRQGEPSPSAAAAAEAATSDAPMTATGRAWPEPAGRLTDTAASQFRRWVLPMGIFGSRGGLIPTERKRRDKLRHDDEHRGLSDLRDHAGHLHLLRRAPRAATPPASTGRCRATTSVGPWPSPFVTRLREMSFWSCCSVAVLPRGRDGRLLLLRLIDSGNWATFGGTSSPTNGPRRRPAGGGGEEAGVTLRLGPILGVLGVPVSCHLSDRRRAAYVVVVFDAREDSGKLTETRPPTVSVGSTRGGLPLDDMGTLTKALLRDVRIVGAGRVVRASRWIASDDHSSPTVPNQVPQTMHATGHERCRLGPRDDGLEDAASFHWDVTIRPGSAPAPWAGNAPGSLLVPTPGCAPAGRWPSARSTRTWMTGLLTARQWTDPPSPGGSSNPTACGPRPSPSGIAAVLAWLRCWSVTTRLTAAYRSGAKRSGWIRGSPGCPSQRALRTWSMPCTSLSTTQAPWACISLQHPLPDRLMHQRRVQAITPAKDVDGVTMRSSRPCRSGYPDFLLHPRRHHPAARRVLRRPRWDFTPSGEARPSDCRSACPLALATRP